MSQINIRDSLSLALRYHQSGRLLEAGKLYRQILAEEPQQPEAMHYLGVIALQLGRKDAAEELIRRAIAIRPDYAEAYSSLGDVLRGRGQYDQALVALNHSLALRPNLPQALDNLANVWAEQKKFDQAIALYRQAIALEPNYRDAHFDLGMALLTLGALREGWEEYEWRWQCPGEHGPTPDWGRPQWDGTPLRGRTLWIRCDDGFGDSIQFARYIPLVSNMGGKILVACRQPLLRILASLRADCQYVPYEKVPTAFDCHVPIMRLAHIFQTTLDTIPNSIPYLYARAADAEKWRRRIAELDPQAAKVGIGWAGNPGHNNDANRSMGLEALAPLGEIPGIQFFSLQKGAASEQAKTPPGDMSVVDWTNDLHDFADTAALIANLDLVIAVDTSVAHLAGAMGKATWVMLPHPSEWRWMLDRTDSPWYPTMRLFRQKQRGEWNSVISEVADALAIWIKNRF